MQFFMLFASNVLVKPAFFTAIIVFVGLLLLKKPIYEALSGFIKTAVGYFILQVGSDGLTATFRPIIQALGTKFNMQASVVDTYFMMGQMYGPEGLFSIAGAAAWTMLSMVIAMITNLVLVALNKITRCRVIYTTGHTLSVYTGVFMWLVFIVCPAAQNTLIALLLGVVGGVWASVGANMTVEATQNLTDGAGFAIGHQCMWGVWFYDKIAGFFGDPNDSVENIKMPGFLSIFKDNVVSTAILMTLFVGGLMIVTGKDAMAAVDASLTASTMFSVYIVTKCLHFSVYMYILLAGVRMFVAELTKAFAGISKKFIKGSMPGVDIAVSFNYAHPNVTMVGFVFGFVGQLIAIAGLLLFKSPLFLIPGFIPLFFDNAAVAVYSNKRGGKRAAIILSIFNGIFQVLVSLVMILFVQKAGGLLLTAWPAFFDNNTVLPLYVFAFKYLPPLVACIVLIVFFLGINQIYYHNHKEHYYDHVEE